MARRFPVRIAVGADERSSLTDAVLQDLQKRGLPVELFGALTEDNPQWPDVARRVAERVATGACDEGILFCWTGTGVSMVANKVAGVRAALCCDSETARGARKWNDANVLCMSLRSTSPAVAKEILDAWLAAEVDESEAANIEKVRAMDRARAG